MKTTTVPKKEAPNSEICEECVMPAQAIAGESVLKCVRCPFCEQTVNAIINPGAIECPKCLAVVRR